MRNVEAGNICVLMVKLDPLNRFIQECPFCALCSWAKKVVPRSLQRALSVLGAARRQAAAHQALPLAAALPCLDNRQAALCLVSR